MVLECKLPADWLPDSVQWFCNEVEVFSSPDYVIAPCVSGVCRLTIVDVFPEDSGAYSCVATYAGEPVTTTMNLSVAGSSSSLVWIQLSGRWRGAFVTKQYNLVPAKGQ